LPPAAEPGLTSRPGAKGLLVFSIPLVLLGAVIAAFVLTNGAGLNITPAAPVETVQFGRTILRPGQIELRLRNTSPEAITISQINVNDAIWPYLITPAHTIPRLGSAVITLKYPWVEGEAYAISIFSSNSIAFSTSIPVAAVTPAASRETLWSFTLVGIYVGIVPIALGMLWLPALRNLGRRGTLFLMSATVGLLIYLGIDATAEALESGTGLGGAFQGIGIIAIGIAGTVLLLDAINRHQSRITADESGRRMSLATMVAVGMGFHNLGEGLAIGAVPGNRLHPPECH
jgi:hypothetical protein